MANTQQYQYEQPNLPENWNESERRFYNRVIQAFDEIYSKFRTETMTQVMKRVMNYEYKANLSATNLAADSFAATFARITELNAKLGSFDFATVKALISKVLVVPEIAAGNVSISNLIVKYAQISEAVFDSVCVRASDGKYYDLTFNPSPEAGQPMVTATEHEGLTPEEIEEGFTRSAQTILALEITADQLNAMDLNAAYALIDTIEARRIDVGQLFAAEAFLTLLRTTAIVGDKSIQMIAQGAEDTSKVFRVESDGAHVRSGRVDESGNIVVDDDATNLRMENDRMAINVPAYTVKTGTTQPQDKDRWIALADMQVVGDLVVYDAGDCMNFRTREAGEQF